MMLTNFGIEIRKILGNKKNNIVESLHDGTKEPMLLKTNSYLKNSLAITSKLKTG